MSAITIILFILFTHWVSDFVLQTDWEAKNKSTNNKALLAHVLGYITPWVIICVAYVDVTNDWKMLWFIPITFCIHWVTDYFTSRLNSRLLKEGKTHEFFVSIGFDQFLHFTQLLITYELLKAG